MEYKEFIQSKIKADYYLGFEVKELHRGKFELFDFQKHIVKWALKKGRAAIFADTGLGKSFMQCAWAHEIQKKTDGRVLILAPLAVSQQTVNEAAKIGVTVEYVREEPQGRGIFITNYEMLEQVMPDSSSWDGIVLDESSILKSFMGKTKRELVEKASRIQYRLACTATPAPNDHMELGNHSEFLGVMSNDVMLSMFFVNDLANTGDWRLKKHSVKDFWQWVCSWAMCVSKPSDIGYDDTRYNLPPINQKIHTVKSSRMTDFDTGELIRSTQVSATNIHKSLRESLDERIKKIQEIAHDRTLLIWCNTNYEADALAAAFPEARDLRGSLKLSVKEQIIEGFLDGSFRVLISKPSICGYGLNFQHCADMVFFGLSFSYEDYYQAIRRCYRFGQTKQVNVHLIIAENEMSILQVVEEKAKAHEEMKRNMMQAVISAQIKGTSVNLSDHNKVATLEGWIYDSNQVH